MIDDPERYGLHFLRDDTTTDIVNEIYENVVVGSISRGSDAEIDGFSIGDLVLCALLSTQDAQIASASYQVPCARSLVDVIIRVPSTLIGPVHHVSGVAGLLELFSS